MARSLVAEGTGAFRQPDPYALFVYLDYLTLPGSTLYQKSYAVSSVCFNLHPDFCVCHITQPPFVFVAVY